MVKVISMCQLKEEMWVFYLFKASANIYLPLNPRDKNQIDIMLEHVNSVADIKLLIQMAYEERE